MMSLHKSGLLQLLNIRHGSPFDRVGDKTSRFFRIES
jgi:hypothetical protein